MTKKLLFGLRHSSLIRHSSFWEFVHSLCSERFDRVHFRGTICGEKAGDECDGAEKQRDAGQGERIKGAGIEEHRSHGSRRGQGGEQSDSKPEPDQLAALSE